MKTKILTVSLLLQVTLMVSGDAIQKKQCSTLSCVHASATIIQKLNTQVDPCEDFYEFACGSFIEQQHTPDEKSTVDTIALMTDKLTEYLLTLLLKESPENEAKLPKLAKTLFNSCFNTTQVNERGREPILNVIKAVGGWPLVVGKGWDETQFDWKQTILKFRQFITKSDEDIFGGNKGSANEIDSGSQGFSDEDNDLARVEKSLKSLIFAMATGLGAEDSPDVKSQIDEIIDFENNLNEYQKKFTEFRRIYEPHFKNKTSGYKRTPELQKYHKYLLYIDLLTPYILKDTSKVSGTIGIDFNVQFQKFLDDTPKRVIANYLFWRIVQSSLSFLDKDLRNVVLTFEKEAFGKEDYEQRWILCTNVVTSFAPVAIGSLYISQYFTQDDKANAERLVDYILQEYVDTINTSTWMDDGTKQRALAKTSKMSKYIGYHEKLRSPEAENFYDDLPSFGEDKFLEMGLGFQILSTDREFKRLNLKKKNKGEKINEDWTKYSKPATVNAFYNSKDNSIQFPAAILQTPNFDKDRPAYMNFGAIGSIIGHEITHAFDDQASKLETWSEESSKAYLERVQCIVNQYSSYRVKEVEEYFSDENIGEFHLNGNYTKKEDIADCGGVKLALKAYKSFENKFPEAQITPIGLQEYNQDKIFWLSFAQTFCSVERPPRKKNKVETDNHSLDRFRVIGAASNLKEFAEAWNCPEGSKMNPKNKCAVW